jgi:hypothetical protein
MRYFYPNLERLIIARITPFSPGRRNSFHALRFSGSRPANPAADISKVAGDVKSPFWWGRNQFIVLTLSKGTVLMRV